MALKLSAPTPLEYFASLVADDDQFPLLEAAISLAQDDEPGLDVQAVLAEVDGLARRLRERIAADASPLQRLRLLNRYFHGELGFAGNPNDFYAAGNSFLHRVLATRRGLPISLGVLWLELAEHAGLRVAGVAFPGHFLVKCRLQQGEAVMDPLTGESLSAARLEESLALYRHADAPALPLEFFLRACPPRQIVARMLRNLREVYQAEADGGRLLRVQQRLALLLPGDAAEQQALLALTGPTRLQ